MSAAANRFESQLSGTMRFAEGLLLIYLFLIVSRSVEILSVIGVRHLTAVIAAMGAVCLLTGGGLPRALKAPQGTLLVLFTMWFTVSATFGIWKGGSFEVFKSAWTKSMLAYLLVAATLFTSNQLRRAMYTLAWSTCVIIAFTVVFGASGDERGAMEVSGVEGLTLGNANAVAAYLLFGMPFTLLLFVQSKTFWRWLVLGPFLVGGAFAMLRTGSRAGLLVALVMGAIVFLWSSWGSKFALAVMVGLGLTLLAAVVPLAVMDRYRTLIGQVNSDDALSAMESSRARWWHFVESLAVTAEYPLFGVGPGNFVVKSTQNAEKRGAPANWKNTHNAYTQLSSEVGIPGMLLYVTALLYSCFTALSVFRRARRTPGGETITNAAFCLFLSLVGLSLDNLFDSNAYGFIAPLLCGLTVALRDIAEREVFAPAEALVSVPAFAGPPPSRPSPGLPEPAIARPPQTVAARPTALSRYGASIANKGKSLS